MAVSSGLSGQLLFTVPSSSQSLNLQQRRSPQRLPEHVIEDSGRYGLLDASVSPERFHQSVPSAMPSLDDVGAVTVLVALAGLGLTKRRSARNARHLRRSVQRRAVDTDSTNVVIDLESNDPASEAEKLQLEAAKLRADIKALEVAKEEQRQKEREQLFRSFDTDKSGALDGEEIRKGLEETCRVNIDEAKASRIVQALDANGDGVLQPEEFSMDKLEQKLAEMRAEEQAKESAAMAAALAEREKQQIQKEYDEYLDSLPERNNDTSLPVRLASCLAYMLPLIDSLKFASYLASQYPIFQSLTGVLLLPALALQAIPYGLGYLLIFFGMQTLASNPELPALLRYNLRQAISLDITLIVPLFGTTLFNIFTELSGKDVPLEVGDAASSAVFLILLSCVAYAVVCNLFGVFPDTFPYISEQAEASISDTRPTKKEDGSSSKSD